jgi:hypothetical protein
MKSMEYEGKVRRREELNIRFLDTARGVYLGVLNIRSTVKVMNQTYIRVTHLTGKTS